MRKIKFRGKCEDTKEWLYGFYTEFHHPNHLEMKYCICTERSQYTKVMGVIPETVSQFTGLTDKNGNEIYEGDVVLCKEFENMGISIYSSKESEVFSLKEFKGECKETYTSQVFYEEANFYVNQDNSCEVPLCCFFGNMKNSNPIFEIEIIGNIHDNPELLNNK